MVANVRSGRRTFRWPGANLRRPAEKSLRGPDAGQCRAAWARSGATHHVRVPDLFEQCFGLCIRTSDRVVGHVALQQISSRFSTTAWPIASVGSAVRLAPAAEILRHLSARQTLVHRLHDLVRLFVEPAV